MAITFESSQRNAKALAAARVLLSILFLVSGALKALGFQGTVAYAAAKGLPLPIVSVIGAMTIELGCGFLLATGLQIRLAAMVLAIFVVPTTLVFHQFWAVAPAQFSDQLYNFLKNVAIEGGLIYVAIIGRQPSADSDSMV